jgi:very-short-patch-repair endonuclease/KaiC/GvpD/RAD55 family RecA-like ATPase
MTTASATPSTPSSAPRPLLAGLVTALMRTYAQVLARQGRTTTPFVRWSRVTNRSHEFAWLGPAEARELLLRGRGPLRVGRSSPLFESVQKMHATASLNPYEREVLYGYPYIVGRCDGETVRAPLLTLAIRIEVDGDGFVVHSADDVVHLNALPFRAQGDIEAHERAIGRIMEATPELPLAEAGLGRLVDAIMREFRGVGRGDAALDGRLAAPPPEPRSGPDGLRFVDQAALFIAPKTSYFLVSDLERIGAVDGASTDSALVPLLGGPGADAQVEIDAEQIDRARVFFPFPSNRAQRRAALLVDDPTTSVVRVEGPPGTGKSLTIANLACHLAATGRTVLITSQKDKALEVVDAKLRELGLAELPMTLLHRDRESKKDLLRRLEGVKKERSRQEVQQSFEAVASRFEGAAATQVDDACAYADAMAWEETIERTHRAVRASGGVRRLLRRIEFWHLRRKARGAAARTTDVLAETTSARRSELLDLAVEALQIGRELAVATASREERAGLRELAAVLKRDQTRYKNFSLFDRLKANPERAAMLLKLLPVWIMTPDDVARLFPCHAGLFDVVIVDEASQVDLPSVTPVAFRGKKIVVFGDSKQMQPRRFAFMSQDVTRQAWQQTGMERLDADRWLHPSEQSLLSLAQIRAEEETLLDEHFRSLPPIIHFSNERWYDGKLRIMTDVRRKRFGASDQPIMQLHRVVDGVISNGSQENEAEARALVDYLAQLVADPDYDGASIGVMCLFEEQVALVQDMIADRMPPEEWEDHDLVVINPDGFQGDERDVILYSLSYDANVMPQAAISARMQDQAHVQGMLNVAFTRSRDEVHVFHTAPIDAFAFADGRPGALGDWLRHCSTVESLPRAARVGSRMGQIDSEFEAEVAAALRGRALRVLHQYPACGFNIDLVAEREVDGARVAVECDGERYHVDEHGLLKVEDLERQAILERAGWRVVRVPYRKWIEDQAGQIQRILAAVELEAKEMLNGDAEADDEIEVEDANPAASARADVIARASGANGSAAPRAAAQQRVTREEAALVNAIREGGTTEEDVFVRARDLLGSQRLTQKLRATLQRAAADLTRRHLIAAEDGEYFLLPDARSAPMVISGTSVPRRTTSRGYRRYPAYRRRGR